MKNPYYIEDVFAVTQSVPEGRVTTYGAIADFLTLGSARMVGWALKNCVADDGIPAHRVVNRKGELSGRASFNPPESMQQRLEAEGTKVENHTVVDFATKFWSPTELS
jgi:methylated-DNA-protein-cysteine methyltransferase-like protein